MSVNKEPVTNTNGVSTPETNNEHADPQTAPEVSEIVNANEESVPLLAPVPFYKSKKFLVWLLIVIVVVLGLGYYAYTDDTFEPAVAEVNGTKITQAKFDEGVDLVTKNAVAQGINLAEIDAEEAINQQVLDVLILNTLIKEAAEDLGIEVTKEEVAAKYQEIISVMAGELGPGETVESKMEEVGISEESFKANLEEQMIADKYLETTANIQEIEVSDEEINEFYATVSEANPSLPSLDLIKEQVRAQLRSEKEQEIVEEILEKLKSDADITINI